MTSLDNETKVQRLLKTNPLRLGLLVGLAIGLLTLFAAIVTNTLSDSQTTDIEYIPVPTGAFDAEDQADPPRIWKGIDFKTKIGIEEVVSFYKSELARRGWAFEFENRNNSTSPYLVWYWSDQEDKTPYVLEFTVTLETLGTGSAQAGSVSFVSITLDRIPILDRTPIYPGAEAVEKKLVKVLVGDEQMPIEETQITFRARATSGEVEDYYKGALAELNWYYGGEASDNTLYSNIPGSLVFRWVRGGFETGQIGASVSLITKVEDTGYTSVELHLRGTNKYVP